LGVKLKDLLDPKETSFEELSHNVIAVDAFNMLYQFITTIRMRDGTPLKNSKGNITSHLVGLLARTTNLLEHNIKLIFIYDGKTPELKSAERARRKGLKDEAKEKYDEAVKTEDVAMMKKYAGRTASLTPQLVKESQRLLDCLGIPWMTAPAEAEAQAAVLVKNGDADYSASQDYDSLLFGVPKLLRNLNSSGKRKRPGTYSYNTVYPEIITLSTFLEELDITQKQLIMLGMLVGTDFNVGGIHGLGPKRGLAKVKEHKEDIDALFEDVGWEFDAEYEEVYDLLAHMPTTDDYEVSFESPDEEALKTFLIDEFEFSETRVNNAIEKINSRQQQKGLREFF
jgi:flap endonuclease-1